MDRFTKYLNFLGWPTISGILLAIVFLQYQQLQQLSEQRINERLTPPPAPVQPSFADAIRLATPSVVSINSTSVNVESIERKSENRLNLLLGEKSSLGSGVIVGDRGFILTNFHVVDTMFALFGAFDIEVTLNDGRKIAATVVAWDEANDLAVLHINMDDLSPIEVGNEQELEVGDLVFAIGYPRNIGQSVSQGIVSALTNNPDDSLSIIQTDAVINPGNSGGALIDRDGKLVGINFSIFSESGNFEGIGFATPASIALSSMAAMVEQAIEGNSGYLGVITGEALNAQSSVHFFGVDHIRGMLVESVDEGGAAKRAGIRPGDVITRIEGTPVIDGQNIMMEVRNKKPGDTITVRVYRNGQTLDFPTILGFGQAIIIEP